LEEEVTKSQRLQKQLVDVSAQQQNDKIAARTEVKSFFERLSNGWYCVVMVIGIMTGLLSGGQAVVVMEQGSDDERGGLTCFARE